MKYIDLPKEKKALLRRMFDTTGVTVWSALNYVTNSDLARRIRSAAMANGGVVKNTIITPDGFMPNCQTECIRGDDGTVQRVIQTFSNGIRVEFDNDRCSAVILHDEELIKMFSDVAIQDWCNIVFEAQNLSDSLNG